MSFTSGGGLGNNSPGKEPPPWVGCLFIIVILVILVVLVSN